MSLYAIDKLHDTYFCPGFGNVTNDLNVTPELNIRQMWTYCLDTENNLVSIGNTIDGVEILNVEINGEKVQKDAKGCYPFTPNPDKGIEVGVEYLVNGKKTMRTCYTPEYNSTLGSFDLSAGIGDLTIDDKFLLKGDVYNLQGVRILSGVHRSEIENLPAGIYIFNGEKIKIK